VTTFARHVRTTEWAAWAIGVLLLSWWLLSVASARHYQHAAAVRFTALPKPEQAPAPVIIAPPVALSVGEIVGRLEVPRLGLSVIVAEGDDDQTLDVAAGHLPDTPLPWLPGNSAVAAHRDSYFRPLKGIRPDDDLRLTTAQGTFTYKVKRVSIVRPEDLSVLRATEVPTLTLITCYPFAYIGHAPKRFIVQAERTVNPAEAGFD
jgi:sortase A